MFECPFLYTDNVALNHVGNFKNSAAESGIILIISIL